MADREELKEAHRVAKDVRQQAMDANQRLIAGTDPQNRALPSTSVDLSARKTANLLSSKLHEKYPENYYDYGGGTMYDLKPEPADPKNYGR